MPPYFIYSIIEISGNYSNFFFNHGFIKSNGY